MPSIASPSMSRSSRAIRKCWWYGVLGIRVHDRSERRGLFATTSQSRCAPGINCHGYQTDAPSRSNSPERDTTPRPVRGQVPQ